MELLEAPLDGSADEAIATRAGEVLSRGGLVIFPTETVYGVGASVASDQGYEALRHVKGRPDSQPFTVHAGSVDDVLRLVDPDALDTRRLIRKVLPGPVTLIVEVADDIARQRVEAMGLPVAIRDRIYSNQTVGLRCPDHPLASRILRSIKAPIVASSANRRGEAPPQDAQSAIEALGDKVDLAIDGGRTRYAKGSTIIRVSGHQPRVKMTIERNGVYDERFVRKLMRWTILMVCSGNTCRSPMAEALAKDMLAQERSISVDDLENAGLRVISAGTSTQAGFPATEEAIRAVKDLGGDLSHHRSRPLTRELIQEADVIYCMTRGHMAAVLEMAPEAANRVYLLDPHGDIMDPIGQSQAVYRHTANAIRQKLMDRLKEE